LSKSILIVDDEPEVLTLLTNIVRRRDIEVTQALGSDQALGLLETTTPDMIIMDLAMPGLNGLDLLQIIRGLPHLSSTRIVIVTARPSMIRGIESADVEDIILKPIRPNQLLQIVDQLV
jgi:CheY-like chemotaxis protein